MITIPKTLGGIIDAMKKLEDAANQHEARAKACWAEYAVLDAHLLGQFGAQKLEGATGKLARIEVHNDPIKDAFPQVDDWDAFYEHLVFGALDVAKANRIIRGPQLGQLRKLILSSCNWELLQKRVGLNAWRERLEQKIVVPGTKVFAKVSLKLLAVKRR
jgi:hypothetical protein